MKLEDVQKICQQQAIVERGIACIQLVYGAAGECDTFITVTKLCVKEYVHFFLLQELERHTTSGNSLQIAVV